MPISIFFDTAVEETAGFINTVEVTNVPGRPLISRDRDTLLHMTFYMTYTQDGRALWKSAYPTRNGPTKAQVKAQLTPELRNRFPGARAVDIDALIDSHNAAVLYLEAKKMGDAATMAAEEEIYVSKLDFLTDQLFKDGLAHDFSMNW